MARFLVAAALLAVIASSSLAFPQSPADDKEDAQGQSLLVLLPPDSDSGDLKFFFPFNFWNIFKPLPWIPISLPGLKPGPGGSGSDDKDDEDKEDDKDDEDKEDDKDDDDKEDDKDDDKEDDKDDDDKEDEDKDEDGGDDEDKEDDE